MITLLLLIDNTKFNVWNQLCEEVKITYIGEVLTKVNECDSHSLYECYLHDFVRIVHNCHHKKTTYADLEYKVIIIVIVIIILNDPPFFSFSWCVKVFIVLYQQWMVT